MSQATDPTLDARGLPPGYRLEPDLELSPRVVRDRLAAADPPALLDCRTPAEHAIARLDGAVLIPMQELPGRVDELAPLAGGPIVVYCHHGIRSLRVTRWLVERGFSDIRSMAGGIDLWSRDVDRAVPRY